MGWLLYGSKAALIVDEQKWICSTNNEILKDDEPRLCMFVVCVCVSLSR